MNIHWSYGFIYNARTLLTFAIERRRTVYGDYNLVIPRDVYGVLLIEITVCHRIGASC